MSLFAEEDVLTREIEVRDFLDKLPSDEAKLVLTNLLNDSYAHLKNEFSTAYQEIFKKRIESITEQNAEAVSKIKNDIKDAYSNAKITELHVQSFE